MNLREVLEMVRIGYPIVVHSESLAITDRKTLNVRPQDAQTCLQVPRIALERSIYRFPKKTFIRDQLSSKSSDEIGERAL